MRLQRIVLLATIGVAAMVAHEPVLGGAADTNDLPHFQELFRLLRAHLPNTSDDDLNRAAVQGLLSQFYPRVILATNDAAHREDSLLSQTTVYDRAYGYLRVARVATGLADQIKSAYEKLGGRNKLKGLVLDLRFAAFLRIHYVGAEEVLDGTLPRSDALRFDLPPQPRQRNQGE